MRHFFNNAIKKSADAAKSLAHEATRKRPQIPLPLSKDQNQGPQLLNPAVSKDVEKLGRLSTDIKSSSEKDATASVASGFKRIQAHKSGPFDFENIQFSQELASMHLGPIWCMRFSQCGQLLATAGQDTTLRIWVLKDSFNYFKVILTNIYLLRS